MYDYDDYYRGQRQPARTLLGPQGPGYAMFAGQPYVGGQPGGMGMQSGSGMSQTPSTGYGGFRAQQMPMYLSPAVRRMRNKIILGGGGYGGQQPRPSHYRPTIGGGYGGGGYGGFMAPPPAMPGGAHHWRPQITPNTGYTI